MSHPVLLPEIRFGPFTLYAGRRLLLKEDEPVRLGSRALDVLLMLVAHRESAVSKTELLNTVWPATVVEENTLQVHVSVLRKLLGPSAIATIPGRGYRFTAALTDGIDVPLPNKNSTPHNLPPERTPFIGRDAALLQCTRLLTHARLLTLTGIGGCGKTRLALQLAQHLTKQQQPHFADGVWFVDLAALQNASSVPHSIAAALQLCEEEGSAMIDRLIAHLAPRCALLVIDNCEHLIDAVNETVDALLSACPTVKIIATSREGLSVAGEQIAPVRPLSLPLAADAASMQASEAVRLFIACARRAVPDFDVDADNAPAVAEICRRLDGIALAVELAAGRVGMLSVADISARLDDRFRFLIGSARALPRHRTLQATLHWSHDSLPLQEQRLFRRLAVFSGGWTLAAAMQVAQVAQVADDGDDYRVLSLLTHLHEKSLLVVDQDGGAPPRYRMLETVRQYAQERLDADSDDARAARDQHLRFFVALAGQALAQIQGPQQGAWMARLAQEQDNLVAAQNWCAQTAEGADAGLRLVAGLWRYWVASAQLERGCALAQTALERAQSPGTTADRSWHCRALLAAGQLTFRMGRYEASLAYADRGLALALDLADAEQTAVGLGLCALGLHAQGLTTQALAHCEQACAMARTMANPFWLGSALNNVAELHRSEGRDALAASCYEEAIDISRDLKLPGGLFVPPGNLARLSVAAGKLARARALLLESLQLAASAELKGMSEDLLEVAAGLASALHDHPAAARSSGAAAARM